MLDIIISSLKKELSQKFSGENGMQQDKVDDAVMLAKDNIFDTVKDEAARGNLSGLMSLLSQKDQLSSHPIVINIIRRYAGNLGAKLGLDPQTAESVASFAIPFAIKKLVSLAEERGIDPGMVMALLGGSGGPGKSSGDGPDLGSGLGGFFK
ncbi:MAG: hypothetical protein ACLFUB_01815 [Cyclobacteriaceae bacterium]